MRFDWVGFRQCHPALLTTIIIAKKIRTKVAILVAAACIAYMIYLREKPLHPDRLDVWVGLAWLLILGGASLRIAALGCIRKKEVLATTGVYSLCRHPLYLGSMLLTYGFCVFMGHWFNFIAATVYFLVFYPITILWEEVRVAERYGAAHQEYCRCVPVFLPLGRYQPSLFSLRQAFSRGGALLVLMIALGVTGVEVMAQHL